MSARRSSRDPEGNELHHLIEANPLVGEGILEIGCGDGSLTSQYSHLARIVVAIDLDFDDLSLAQQRNRSDKVHYVQALAENLPFPRTMFDLVLFASSL